MSEFVVTLSEGNACSDDYQEFKATFKSQAKTWHSVISDARIALFIKYGRDFVITPHDVEKKVINVETCSYELLYLDRMQDDLLYLDEMRQL